MTTKNCALCAVEFTYTPSQYYEDKRKYCDACKKVKDLEFAAKKPVEQNGPVNPEVEKIPAEKPVMRDMGTVFSKTLADNSYEWGIMPKAGCPYWKHKVKYETLKELRELVEGRKDIKFEPEGFPQE